MVKTYCDIFDEYIKQLSDQKEIYNKILLLSDKESGMLQNESVPMGIIVQILQRKEELLEDVSKIESDISSIRDQIRRDVCKPDADKSHIVSSLVKDIGSILEMLLKTDALNEQLIQRRMRQNSAMAVSKRYAVKAYGAYCK